MFALQNPLALAMGSISNSGLLFLEELKETYPDLSIIQNRGFKLLQKGSGIYLDGVLYEDFTTIEGSWYENVKNVLNNFLSTGDKTVLAVNYEPEYYKTTRSLAIQFDWKFYARDNDDYSTWQSYLTSNEYKAEDAVEKAVLSKDVTDILKARNLVNYLNETAFKDQLQSVLTNIFPNLTLDKQSATSNLDVYIKSENMLSLSLNTNSVTFENYSGTEPMEKKGAINISINSSLPYDLYAYIPSEISNTTRTNTLPLDIFNIREGSQTTYQKFENNTDKVILKEYCTNGNDLNHSIDLKLDSSNAHKVDVYKTTIRLEVKQK
ncbi:MAG: hypothetical protein IJ086_15915 [Clostridium sp.]|nr:hypothetical protein [Clostridium sp.]